MTDSSTGTYRVADVTGYIPAAALRSLRITSLGSGSSGNCFVCQTRSTTFLVDCGVAPRVLAQGLGHLGLGYRNLRFVFVTHEHIDHVRSLNTLRRANVPVIASAGTIRALRLDSRSVAHVATAGPVEPGDFRLTPIVVSHDATEPLGVVIDDENDVVTILTDTGTPPQEISAHLGRSSLVIIEANHDVSMLRAGPYPSHLKRRIASSLGHMSNDETGNLLATALASCRDLPAIWLAHLSTTNNSVAVARATVARLGGLREDSISVLPRRTFASSTDDGFQSRGIRVSHQLLLEL